jgi:A/G-specific adenine glycosylase
MLNPVAPLLHWYAHEGRELPWRVTRDPYRIWLSEVILQQTRIDQGTAYYYRFLELFPTVHDLANASTDAVMKAWEGLGYYARARNLHATAQQVAQDFNGIFPNDYRELEKLKGIGPYTARAIGSIAFGNPVGVLDGNVFRVLSRFLGDDRPIDLGSTRQAFQAILDQWIAAAPKLEGGRNCASEFNQAMMDIGAMVCTPRNFACNKCPLQTGCVANREGTQANFPVKGKKLLRKTIYHHFFLTGQKGKTVWVQRRPATGIWAMLWEIPNEEVTEQVFRRANLEGYELLGTLKHVFTHMDMHIKVYRGEVSPLQAPENALELPLGRLNELGFSRAVLKIFECYLTQES